MPAGTFTLYQANIDDLSLQALAGATLKMTLHTSGYTPSVVTGGHSVAADLTNELATGGGYTAGGVTLTNVTVTAVTGGWKISSDDVEWTAGTGGIPAWRYAVLRVDGSLAGKTSPLIGYFVGDSAPADVPATTEGNPLTITCPAAGWYEQVVA